MSTSENAAYFGSLTWTGGTMTVPSDTPPNTAHTIVQGGMSLTGNNITRILNGRTLDNLGLAQLSGNGSLQVNAEAVLNNPPGSTFEIADDGDLLWNSTTALGSVNNGGTFSKSGGAGVSDIRPIFNNAGLLHVQIGTLRFLSGGLTQTDGSTLLDGGALKSTPPINIHGGILTGNGTVTGNVNTMNTGAVHPGQSAGVIDIVGNYTQTTTGELEIELGGYTQGEEFDLLTVSAAASLNGTLHVALIDGFLPQIGDQFVVLTAGSVAGTFASVVTTPPALEVNVLYDAQSVKIEIVEVPTILCGTCGGDVTGDNAVDGDDVGAFVACLFGGATACDCADMNADSVVDSQDVDLFVAKLLEDVDPSCP